MKAHAIGDERKTGQKDRKEMELNQVQINNIGMQILQTSYDWWICVWVCVPFAILNFILLNRPTVDKWIWVSHRRSVNDNKAQLRRMLTGSDRMRVHINRSAQNLQYYTHTYTQRETYTLTSQLHWVWLWLWLWLCASCAFINTFFEMSYCVRRDTKIDNTTTTAEAINTSIN